jgi:hypothetical protein
MNVIIMQISGSKAIVLNKMGEFLTIAAQKGMKPGCEFHYEKPIPRPTYRFVSAIAASIVVFLMSAAILATFTISTYVDVNINPGVRISLNPFGMVVKVEAINNDGEMLLSGLKTPLFSSVESELALLISRAHDDGYLKDSSGILITISDDNPSRLETRERALFDASLKCLQEKKINAAVTTQKINLAALDDLRRQEISVNASSYHERYTSKSWHTSSNPLFIERVVAINGDSFKVIFSRDVNFTGVEHVVLFDGQGTAIDCQVKSHSGDEWTITCEGLKTNQGYYLTITSLEQSPGISASLWIAKRDSNNTGNNDDATGNNTNDNQTNDNQPKGSPLPTPKASADIDDGENESGQNDNTATVQPSHAPDKTHTPETTSSSSNNDKDNNDDSMRTVQPSPVPDNTHSPETTSSPGDHDKDNNGDSYTSSKPDATARHDPESNDSNYSDKVGNVDFNNKS